MRRSQVTIVYNEPIPSKYWSVGEGIAIASVMDEVKAVNHALIALGYESVLLPFQPPLSEVRPKLATIKSPLVFNLFEGFDGSPETEAIVASMMEELGLRFTGNPSHTLALAQHKDRAKEVLRATGIPTADYQVLTPETLDQFRLTFPCFAKPVAEDASHGISPNSLVENFAALEAQVKTLHRTYNNAVLVETFLSGREFNATVIGSKELQVLPPSEIVYTLPEGKPHILTYSAKWDPKDPYFSGTKVKCPAQVEPELRERIEKTAAAAFCAMGCRGYARADMRLSAAGQLMVLEVNPNPDISPGTGAALQSQAAKLTYAQFIGKIIALAEENTPECPTPSAA